MTTTVDLDPVQEATRIAAQNDAFRRSILGTTPVADAPQGQFVMTRGVAELGLEARLELTRRVAAFDAFTNDSDPHGWHEMGVIDFEDTTVWFKVDLYDVDYTYGSPEPSDPEQTRRVLTLLLPSEY
ncbi:hypothetical protein A3734_19710 [Sulfitobacter sp. HI0054]|uniref:DUF3768 domain-containing protein n=1 Tax=Sulfitobacter sp. HI0054 TaxID=1822238 RepID=UPI0007C22A95|nr:DUF3768 domain-containing protein [Sulfitobacter sp. HI0054]KZY52122.1 hypothetical protein A3734_19710 [Sulfitobacter sp. HI0054]